MEKKFSVMRIIGNGAVLQSRCDNRVFGSAPALSDVSLVITGEGCDITLAARTDNNGRWELVLPPFEPSFGEYRFEFSCCGKKLSFTGILFGELFHISGQSNMELPMSRTYDPFAPSELPTCEYVREFRVPVECVFGRKEEYEDFRGGEWKSADKDNVPDMSAAGFYFALSLYEKYRVPVGLLNTSAGGAPIEAFMPYPMLSELGYYDDFLAKCTADGYMERTAAADMKRNEEREAELERLDTVSESVLGGSAEFVPCTVPFDLNDNAELRGFCGHIWFRRTFVIPDDADLSDAVLILGTLTDADIAYINGKCVGETGYMYPPRIYRVPNGAAVHGENTLLIRLDVRYACGGFTKGKRYCLKLGGRIIDLSGEWGYAVAAKVPCMERETFFQGLPLSMYGALTAPVFNVRCRALIFYQGESNCSHPERYSFLFGKFTQMYRERCGHDIPVIFTQLCNYDDPFAGGSDSWAELRNAQLECLKIPGTDMAVTIDVGESNDLHPLNKRDVGKRLALCAMRTVFGDKSVKPAVYCTGASYTGNGKVLVTFDDNSRVRLGEDGVKCFDIIAGVRRIPAISAELTENGIMITFAPDERPDKVRCEWRNDPEPIALYDTDGLPLSPFEAEITEASEK